MECNLYGLAYFLWEGFVLYISLGGHGKANTSIFNPVRLYVL